MVVEMVQLQHYDSSANSPAVMPQNTLRHHMGNKGHAQQRITMAMFVQDILRLLILYPTCKYIVNPCEHSNKYLTNI